MVRKYGDNPCGANYEWATDNDTIKRVQKHMEWTLKECEGTSCSADAKAKMQQMIDFGDDLTAIMCLHEKLANEVNEEPAVQAAMMKAMKNHVGEEPRRQPSLADILGMIGDGDMEPGGQPRDGQRGGDQADVM